MPDTDAREGSVQFSSATTMTSVRALWSIVRLAYRRDPRRTVLALIPVAPLLAGGIALSGRAILTSGHDHRGGVIAAAVSGGVLLAAAAVTGYWQAANGLLRLVQVTSSELDFLLLSRLAEVPTIDLFDDSELVDRLELLRVGRGPLVNALALLGALLSLLVGTLVTAALFAAVNPWLIPVPLLVVPVVVVYARSEAAAAAAEERVAENRRLALHLYDVGTGPAEGKELRVLGNTDALVRRYEDTWESVSTELNLTDGRNLWQRLAAWASYCVVLAATLAAVLRHASAHHSLSSSSVFLLAMATTQLTFLTSNGAWTASSLRNALKLAGHYAELLRATQFHARSSASTDGPQAPAPESISEGICLRDTCFRYPGADVDTLGPIDLDLPPGSVTAIVGPNGAGKTTLVNLLLGLRRPTAGTILVDAQSLAGIDPVAWYSKVAMVCQDFTRFELTVRESVAAGDLERLDDDVATRRALENAEAASFVAALPGGLDTVLGQRLGGRELSGGQWQRIAMARGLMRPAPLLLILDEPTVSMDAATEQRLLDRCVTNARALAESHGTVVVFVSHRYATTRLADHIVVIENGLVVEQGTHASLLAQGDRYADVYRSQALAYRR